MTQPLICLGMIVRNEATNIRKTLESAKPFVDNWVIIDTGSTDGTPTIVREIMDGVPGMLYQEPFIDFASSRNRVLDLVADSVFVLSLSGDETLEGGAELRAYLEAQREGTDGAHCVEMQSRQPGVAGVRRWLYPRILRTEAKWRYVGDPHEIPEGPHGERTGPTAIGVKVIHTESDPMRKYKRMREYDLPRLTARATNETHELEERAQAIWFLAQTHEALANEFTAKVPGGPWMEHKLNAMSLYQKRSELGEDPIKSSYAWLCSLKIADQIGFLYTHEELIGRLNIIVEMSPKLPEARVMLALHSAQLDARKGLYLAEEAARIARIAVEESAKGDQSNFLPIDSSMEWQALRIAAECAKALGNKKRMRELGERALLAGGPRPVLEEYLAL